MIKQYLTEETILPFPNLHSHLESKISTATTSYFRKAKILSSSIQNEGWLRGKKKKKNEQKETMFLFI